MGILSFLKKKTQKPTLLSDIKKLTPWIIDALNSSGYKVDMGIESLKEIDRFFDEQMDDAAHRPKPGGLLSEGFGLRSFAIGAYVGEVMIREYGGVWITDDNDARGEINISVELSGGTRLWPAQRIMKRCAEGPENGIYSYAAVAGSI